MDLTDVEMFLTIVHTEELDASRELFFNEDGRYWIFAPELVIHTLCQRRSIFVSKLNNPLRSSDLSGFFLPSGPGESRRGFFAGSFRNLKILGGCSPVGAVVYCGWEKIP